MHQIDPFFPGGAYPLTDPRFNAHYRPFFVLKLSDEHLHNKLFAFFVVNAILTHF